jgi:hypothetical protein
VDLEDYNPSFEGVEYYDFSWTSGYTTDEGWALKSMVYLGLQMNACVATTEEESARSPSRKAPATSGHHPDTRGAAAADRGFEACMG